MGLGPLPGYIVHICSSVGNSVGTTALGGALDATWKPQHWELHEGAVWGATVWREQHGDLHGEWHWKLHEEQCGKQHRHLSLLCLPHTSTTVWLFFSQYYVYANKVKCPRSLGKSLEHYDGTAYYHNMILYLPHIAASLVGKTMHAKRTNCYTLLYFYGLTVTLLAGCVC